MKPKELVLALSDLYDLENINWKKEMFLAKKLLAKYDDDIIMYCLNHYKDKGFSVNSLGWFTYKNFKSMEDPISLHKAELNIDMQESESGERNKERFEYSSKANGRKEHYFDLFEES